VENEPAFHGTLHDGLCFVQPLQQLVSAEQQTEQLKL